MRKTVLFVQFVGGLKPQTILAYGFATNIANDHSMNNVKLNCSLKNQIPEKLQPMGIGSAKIALKTLQNVSVAKRRELS
jgi:hypothetical protein